MNIQQPLIEAPASDNYRAVQTLGYLDAYDAVLNDDYAFVAFKETEKSSGSYEIKIKSRHTAGAVFDPAMIRAKCREAGAHNQPYFTWGYSLSLIHISEPTRLLSISYAVFCLK